MSAIGEYVHYSKAGYNDHGIYRNTSSRRNNYQEVIQRHRDISRKFSRSKNIEKGVLKGYEYDYNTYINWIRSKPDQIFDKIRKAIVDKVNARYAKDGYQIMIDWSNLTFHLQQTATGSSNNQSLNLKRVRQLNSKQYSFVSTVFKRISTALEMVTQYEQDKAISAADAKSLKKPLKDIKKEIIKMQNNREFKTLKEFSGWKDSKYTQQLIMEKSQADDYINRINQYIAGAIDLASSNILGYIFESVAECAELYAKKLGEEKLEEALKEFAKQKKTKGEKLYSSILSIGEDIIALDSEAVKTLKDNTNRITRRIVDQNGIVYAQKFDISYSSQGKMDASFTFNGNNLGLSLKNVNMANNFNLSLQSGQTLLVSLITSLENDHDYINHMLNILAEHDNNKKTGYGNTQENQFQTYAGYLIRDYKIYLLYSALTGINGFHQSHSEQFADILVIHDNSSKDQGVRFYDPLDIIGKLEDNFNRAYIKTEPNLVPGILKNDYVVAAGNTSKLRGAAIRRRLSNLIVQARQMKLKVMLDKNFFSVT